MKIILRIFLWILCIAGTAGLTFFVTDNYNKRQQAEAMFSQFRQFTEIREDLNRIRNSLVSMESDIGAVRDSVRTDMSERFEKFGECSVLDQDVYSRLREVFEKIEKRGRFKGAAKLRENFESSHHAYQESMDLAMAAQKDFSQSFSDALAGFEKRARLLRGYAAANTKKYKTMLAEVRELLKLPVQIDFDPQKDIKYVKKRIRQAEREIVELTELQKSLADLKNKAN